MSNMDQVKELRERTSAGILDCKKALEESGNDVEKAAEWLKRKVGSRVANPRAATEGVVESYIHMGGKIGVLIEVNCETDFAARSDRFKTLVRDLALQVAAASPTYVDRSEVMPGVLDHETNVLKAQLKEQGKPEKLWDKIIPGKLEKFYQEHCLLDQPFVKDSEKTVQQVVNEASTVIGETIKVYRITRYVMGEGREKKQTDFAAEVAAAGGAATPAPEPKAMDRLGLPDSVRDPRTAHTSCTGCAFCRPPT